MVVSMILALYLRLGLTSFSEYLPILLPLLPLFLAIRLAVFVFHRVYDIIWRYTSFSDVLNIAWSVSLSTLLTVSATYMVDVGRIPRGVFLIEAVLILTFLCGIRCLRRLLHEYPSARQVQRTGCRTLIYGAGCNGRALLNRMRTDEQIGYHVLGFIDDDPEKVGRRIAGLEVLGGIDSLERVLRSTRCQELIIAISSPSGALIRKIMGIAYPLNIRPRIIKPVTKAHLRRSGVEIARDIELADLLSRPQRPLLTPEVCSLIAGRRVVITGAGGSIGSELAKQIYNLSPAQMILLDHSEHNLYQIDRVLRATPNAVSEIVPSLLDLRNLALLKRLFAKYRPEIVFHAAAYKHVHLAEVNPEITILNNVSGTKNLIDATTASQSVHTFVLISTDKAVNPAGVMGATKRLCELMVTAAGNEHPDIRFVSVRFGNVLGSSGSLIPMLTEQIQNNEAVTITHRAMKRYFMLIPEAVSLVLKAATIARSGDIMVLKMGDPIPIVEIVNSLIALLGKNEKDVPVIFTGLRPGEKLVEELYLTGDEIDTEDSEIMVVPRGDSEGVFDSHATLMDIVNDLIHLALIDPSGAVHKLANVIDPVARAAISRPPRDLTVLQTTSLPH